MPTPDPNFLTAGVAPGGLYSREQIRLLLCWLALRLPEPLTAQQAERCFMEEGLANYFEFYAALDSLLAEGRLEAGRADGATQLRIPGPYRRAVEELALELPRQARARALFRAEQIQERERRERDNLISVYPLKDGGFLMTFRQGSGSDTLMSVTVYLADREQVERVRGRFLREPGRLYEAVIGVLEG